MGNENVGRTDVNLAQLASMSLKHLFILKALGHEPVTGQELRKLIEHKGFGEQKEGTFSKMMSNLELRGLVSSEHTTRRDSGKTLRGKKFFRLPAGDDLMLTVENLLLPE